MSYYILLLYQFSLIVFNYYSTKILIVIVIIIVISYYKSIVLGHPIFSYPFVWQNGHFTALFLSLHFFSLSYSIDSLSLPHLHVCYLLPSSSSFLISFFFLVSLLPSYISLSFHFSLAYASGFTFIGDFSLFCFSLPSPSYSSSA